jgi:hypothetical protein
MRRTTFPGTNGPILFRNVDFETGWGVPLLRALPDGTQVTRISRRPAGFSDWRADGGRIAIEFVQRDGDVQIATARPDGRDLRVITSGPGIHEIPSWSRLGAASSSTTHGKPIRARPASKRDYPDPSRQVPRAPHVVARQPLDPIQPGAQRDYPGDAPKRPRPAHDPEGRGGLRRPPALVLARGHTAPLHV